MNIQLGDLSISEMEKKAGVTFPEALVDLLKDSYQPIANSVGEGEWHCFDIPFVLVVGGMPMAQAIYDHLQKLSSQFTEQLQISLAS